MSDRVARPSEALPVTKGALPDISDGPDVTDGDEQVQAGGVPDHGVPSGVVEVTVPSADTPASAEPTAAPAEPGALVDLPINPIPPNAHPGMLRTPDGIRLRYARFEPDTRPSRGTVLVLSGRAESIEKYFETIRDLQRRDFHVLAFDWRGQGRSDRLTRDPVLGHVETFDDYVIDLETVMREIMLPDCRAPFFLLAHSMGALVALMAGPRVNGRFRRMVLSAPLLAFGSSLPVPQRWIAAFAGTLSVLGLGRLHATGRRRVAAWPFIGNLLTSDQERHSRWQATIEAVPSLTLGGPSFGWLHAACRAMKRAREPSLMAAQTVPALFVSPTGDTLIDSEVTERYAGALRTGAYLPIPGARHEILLERDRFRDPFWSAFDAFVPGTDPFQQERL